MASKLQPAFDAGQFVDDLVRCETRLYNALTERVRHDHGITMSQFEFLRFVRDHDGARVVDLATEFAAGVGAMSKGADRLEHRGWIERQKNPQDRRSLILVLTDVGRDLTDHTEQTVETALAELVTAAIGQTAVATAAMTVLATLRASLEADRVGLPTG